MDKARAARVIKAMQMAGYTRDSLAEITGYSVGVITKIRKGADFRTDQLIAICSVLGVTPDYILGFTATTELAASVIKEVIEIDTRPELEIVKEITALIKKSQKTTK